MKVAFYKGTRPGLSGIFNRLMRWRTNSPYSHCELVLAPIDDAYLCASSSLEDGGVRFVVTKLDPARWDIVGSGIGTVAERAAVEWFNDHLGEPYNFAAMFSLLWSRRHREGHWHCSESIGAALGIREPWRFDPATLYAALSSDPMLSPPDDRSPLVPAGQRSG
ncbi:hypothetical protein [Paraburkholderia phenoliruptrix]|uniref:hypothetical protein n=1 Tax=Paraburkholderia phenoliruptrix TaxID=252970 RepID=UPI001C6F3EF1|nr:hypothetical protein [Paraburkholderia phenoliruptrix]MBW9104858.1 hypothetical protein [Paraburkholderia phenoliruptrix]MBW9131884.1 hypothetical protein [Paraburkholderia ginsengiterrae]